VNECTALALTLSLYKTPSIHRNETANTKHHQQTNTRHRAIWPVSSPNPAVVPW
jgi:hypothetical protein